MNKLEKLLAEIERRRDAIDYTNRPSCAEYNRVWAYNDVIDLIKLMLKEPSFKVGDIIVKKDDRTNRVQISDIDGNYYYAGNYTILIGLQDAWELEEPVNEDFETAAREASIDYQMARLPFAIGGDTFSEAIREMNLNPSFIDGAKFGAQWQKEQIMKNTIDGEVLECYDSETCRSHMELFVDVPKEYKDGDKVKLVIVKED